jgi:hypothetical protein
MVGRGWDFVGCHNPQAEKQNFGAFVSSDSHSNLLQTQRSKIEVSRHPSDSLDRVIVDAMWLNQPNNLVPPQ